MTDIVERLRERRALGFDSRPGFGRDKAALVWITKRPEQQCHEAADEIERLRAMTTWRPIETAPMDGTDILAYIPGNHGEIEIVAWTDDGAGGMAWCRARCVDGLEAGTPTHWMPLPEPPQ